MTPVASLHEQGDCEITIGTSPECDVALSDPVFQTYLSGRHACLKRRGRRYYVKDLQSAQGTFVNGFRVGRRWVRIALHDDVYLGKCPFKVAGLILKAQQVSLQARHLRYSIAGKGGCRRTLVSDVSFKVAPGELVGILGPSGAGKTVLLNLLSGALRPTADAHGASGFVTVNDRFVLHKEKDLLKDFIGFVPQDDILIPELTVARSLAYSLELKYCDSGIERGFKQRRIDATLEKLGFAGEKRSDFLNTPIGSPDTRRGLSGGERRRANIAQELIKTPLLLFLDEPTSGLSSVDADHIVGLLRNLSQVDRTTVITTIHQPSAASFSLFDKVLILNHGGKVAYFGPPDKAVAYFEAQSDAELGNRNPAEFILETLDRWSLPEAPEAVFLATEAVKNGLPETPWAPPAENVHTVSRGTVRGGLRQFLTLLRRHFSVARADRGNVWFLLLQPLLVAGLIILCFFGYQDDYRSQTRDERIVFHVVQKSGQGLRLTRQNLQKASTWADAPQNSGYLSFGAANRLGAIYFLLIVAAIWIGIINTCREIVGEKAILRREGGTYLRMSAYLLSKWVFFALLSALQVGLIVVAVRAGLVPGMPGLFFWGILSLTSACATCIGLALSGLVGSQRMALTAVPLVLIPQLLFGGLVRPVRYISSGFDWIHHLMLQKWAFFASLLGGDHLGVRVLSKMTDFSNYDVTRRLVYRQESLAEIYFGALATAPDEALVTALTVVAGQGLAVLLLAYLVLRFKYAR